MYIYEIITASTLVNVKKTDVNFVICDFTLKNIKISLFIIL